MHTEDRAMARKHLDKRLSPFRDSTELLRPSKGWIKAIREALGMTAVQLAHRIGVTKPRVYAIEKAELSGSITLDSLERAAHALDCTVVYALVPREPLQERVEARAISKAKQRIQSASHTMTLEDQAIDKDALREQVGALAEKLLTQSGSRLWEDT